MYRYNQPPEELRLPASLGLDVGPEADLVIVAWRQVILGFSDPSDFVEDVRDEFKLPDAVLAAAFEAVLAARREQQASFADAATTTLTKAFIELNARGILALEGFSCCAECGARDIHELLDTEQRQRGYVFYHQADAEHLVDHGHVELTFGAALDQLMEPEEYQRLLPEGKQWWFEQVSVEFFRDEVLPVLADYGIKVEWNREFGTRPMLSGVDFYAEV
ncbi:hypothetical protein [Propionicimonas sp.]|uniref:DUF6891 domain-containing protein n=1 Tax=Propionicimonas sp. TaxID=1955623 RepID=UPI00184604F4|nr:hypothetical protein [Propionicimonas sp.]MBU3977689.1 hypothetical protein [Actinomycetota bacterium]MBA3021613.1 hypothetical protein [Propionicimonas sp.]MBU3987163.1 hypothetical protein [Actinomycetota bacterium]MBU4008984.1 hypothetical protein [Actinomycetota bacterium]MBU4065866.1 hypothetical protein [Actinomycetota bacterium]